LDVELDTDEWAGSNWFCGKKFWLFWFPIPLVDGVATVVGLVIVVGTVVVVVVWWWWWWLSDSGWWWEDATCSDGFADEMVTVWSLLVFDRCFRLPPATFAAVPLMVLNISLEDE
jgi:hypothetical protein